MFLRQLSRQHRRKAPSEIEDFMFQLLDLTGDEVESVMLSIRITVIGSKDGSDSANVPEDSIQAFLNAAEYSVNSESEEEPCMSRNGFKKLGTVIPSIKRFLASLLTPSHAGLIGRQIPSLVVPEAAGCSPMLRNEYAWHISGILQQHEAQEWVLLCHSSMNGLSLSTFLANLTGVKGPTILVIKDKEGCIYGAYASQPSDKHSTFMGT